MLGPASLRMKKKVEYLPPPPEIPHEHGESSVNLYFAHGNISSAAIVIGF